MVQRIIQLQHGLKSGLPESVAMKGHQPVRNRDQESSLLLSPSPARSWRSVPELGGLTRLEATEMSHLKRLIFAWIRNSTLLAKVLRLLTALKVLAVHRVRVLCTALGNGA